MKKRLITSALPYVNNIPHLGNLIQVLSADVFARFCRMRGYETLYICGTDEYGTATETRAREEGITPRELCDRYYEIHDEIYRWFNISFDRFGRTSTEWHTKITQDILLKLHENGYITEHTIEQLYSEASDMFLADRYVRGTCPHCGYGEARGDQCENCGKLLDPTDLIDPRSALDGTKPIVRETRHLYINLPAIRPKLEEWMKDAAKDGKWARNAVQMTNAWIRDGLKERSITRDLNWGIPVPIEGFTDKVIYVWFDAPIGYVSITANHTDAWESWWRDPENTELFQFIGKDNIPFHTVIFPSSLLGSGDRWTMLHHMSSTEYMNYEAGKFSKSKGIGVFGNDAMDTGIPADVWRFYMYYNRPESSDYLFTWDDFREKVNGELIGNLSNLVNRTLTFVHRYFDGRLADTDALERFRASGTPVAKSVADLWSRVSEMEAKITDLLEWANLRDAFRTVFAVSSLGNKTFQDAEPWKSRHDDPEGTQALLTELVYLIRDLAVLSSPYIPQTAERIAGFLGVAGLSWGDLGTRSGLSAVSAPEILFQQLSEDDVAAFRLRFSGSQAERAAAAAAAAGVPEGEDPAAGATGPTQPAEAEGRPEETRSLEERFSETVRLVAAKITSVEKHPKADRLYVEQLDDGSGEERRIVSGLVGHYEADELEGRTIIVVDNLKPAKLRGVESEGMLLAASDKDAEGNERVDVLFLEDVEPGTAVTLLGEPAPVAAKRIDIDTFFSIPIRAEGGVVKVGETPLAVAGKEIRTSVVQNGSVG
ncbi:MAG: methionine--tRNA ligase [Spirochaetota bacterium]